MKLFLLIFPILLAAQDGPAEPPVIPAEVQLNYERARAENVIAVSNINALYASYLEVRMKLEVAQVKTNATLAAAFAKAMESCGTAHEAKNKDDKTDQPLECRAKPQPEAKK